MQTISFTDADFAASLELLYNRPAAPDFAEKAASGILEEVRTRGECQDQMIMLCPIW